VAWLLCKKWGKKLVLGDVGVIEGVDPEVGGYVFCGFYLNEVYKPRLTEKVPVANAEESCKNCKYFNSITWDYAGRKFVLRGQIDDRWSGHKRGN